MKGDIVMSRKEVNRLSVLDKVKEKVITVTVASTALGFTYRHTWRLWMRYKTYGAAGLVHGNRGREPRNKTNRALREKILKLFQEKYSPCNDTHYTELLLEREGIKVSRETIRKVLRGAGIGPKRKRRAKKHHSRRERMAQAGSMVLWDGSPHKWFGPERPPCCLMTVVDDATSRLLSGIFVQAEGSISYLVLLENLLRGNGIPLIIYHDRHSSLVRVDNEWSLEEELQGRQFPTHVGRVLEELGVRSIPAYSPQAKGRIERAFGTLQDRLMAEMNIDGIKDMEKANRWLYSTFIDRYNKRFGVKAREKGSAFRAISRREIHRLVSFAYEAIVGNDNCVRLGGMKIDIPPGKDRRGYAKEKVLVRQHLDGSWTVWSRDGLIAKHPPTELREPIRQWKLRTPGSTTRRKGTKSATQVYISSKPAPPPIGHFPFAVNRTY